MTIWFKTFAIDYICRIIVIFTTVSEPLELTVIPKSVVTVKHFDAPVRVNCSARGVPRPNITWYKEGVEMPTKIIINGDEITAELNLERLRPSEQGDYNCVGITSVRPDEPFSYSTKIREYSSFSTFHWVYIDASVNFYCLATVVGKGTIPIVTHYYSLISI